MLLEILTQTIDKSLGKKIETTKLQLESTYGKYFDLIYGDIQGDKLILKGFVRNTEKIDKEYRMLSFYTLISDKK